MSRLDDDGDVAVVGAGQVGGVQVQPAAGGAAYPHAWGGAGRRGLVVDALQVCGDGVDGRGQAPGIGSVIGDVGQPAFGLAGDGGGGEVGMQDDDAGCRG